MDLSSKTYSPTREGQEDRLLTMTVRNVCEGSPGVLKSSLIVLSARPLGGSYSHRRLGNLNAMGVIGSGVAGAK